MRGVQYVVDDKGEPQDVLIDLKKHGKVWEDFQDLLVSHQRRDEPCVSLAEVSDRFRRHTHR